MAPATSKKRIAFHLGWPKTGTTALQYVLQERADAIRESGVYVPPNILDPSNPDDSRNEELRTYIKGRSHSTISNELMGINDFARDRGLDDKTAVAGAFDNAVKAFAQSDCSNMALSHEGLFWSSQKLPRGFFDRYAQDYRIDGLAYARRYDSYLVSLYRQNIKSGFAKPQTFAEFVDTRLSPRRGARNRVLMHLEAFRELGIRVELRSYDERRNEVLEDALQFFGVEPKSVPTNVPPNLSNPSLADEVALFIFELQRRLDRPMLIRKAVREMQKMNRTGGFQLDLPRLTVLNDEIQTYLVKRYNEDMAEVSEYCGHEFRPQEVRKSSSDRRFAERLTTREYDAALASLPAEIRDILQL